MSVCPSVGPSGEISGHLPENAWREWPEILNADVSWPSSELMRLWSEWFSSVWRHFDLVKRVKFWVSGLMYLDHLQNWLVYGHSQLIFLILALFWLSEMGQIWHFRAFPRERMEGIACNFACCSILTTFRTLVGYCCLAPKRQRCHLSDKMRKI